MPLRDMPTMLLYPPKTNPYLPVQLPNMIYAILGDIHGNLEALEAVLNDAKGIRLKPTSLQAIL